MLHRLIGILHQSTVRAIRADGALYAVQSLSRYLDVIHTDRSAVPLQVERIPNENA